MHLPSVSTAGEGGVGEWRLICYLCFDATDLMKSNHTKTLQELTDKLAERARASGMEVSSDKMQSCGQQHKQ